MSNQRETIINHIFDVLETIQTSGGFNTNPVVERERQQWVDTVNFPALFLDEGEPEDIEHLAFGTEIAYLNLFVLGRQKGEWSDINKLVEDVRKVLDSSANTYKTQTDIVKIIVTGDPNSDSKLKEFEMSIRIYYTYDRGSA